MTQIASEVLALIAKAVDAGAYLRLTNNNGEPLGPYPSSRDGSTIRGALKTFPEGRVALDLATHRIVGIRVGVGEAEEIEALFEEYGEDIAPAIIEPGGDVAFLFVGDRGSNPRHFSGDLPLPVTLRPGSPDLFAALKTGALKEIPRWLADLLAGRRMPAPPQPVATAPSAAPAAPSCARCKAFRPIAGRHGHGLCALAPPIFGVDQNGYTTPDIASWPEVSPTTHCGKYASGRASGACRACRHFEQWDPSGGVLSVTWGRCTANPPLRPVDNSGSPVNGPAVFPRVSVDDGCAAFQAASQLREVA